ncbi:MAG: response regulator, partial [Planctomycetes bacterium]|nr:response regulator [Planctomycetota bacterium]
DCVPLLQVIINLLSNALKFTEDGRFSVFVDDEGDPLPSASRLRISVQDSGAGIAADKLQRIFESAFQAHEDSAVRLQGLGLGLSISQRIVESMGGQIRVSSEEGVGSIFSLHLEIPHTDHSTGGEEDVSSLRVLLADDDALNRKIAARIFEKAGLSKADFANNGLQAAELAECGDYDLVILDLNMPGMTGVKGLARIRKAKPSIRAIVLSADVDEKQMLAAGFDAALSKPLNPEKLLRCIRGLSNHKV